MRYKFCSFKSLMMLMRVMIMMMMMMISAYYRST